MREVLPHVPDAWVDYDKTKIGYEIPINRHFYVYKSPRPLDQIEADINKLERQNRWAAEGAGDMNTPLVWQKRSALSASLECAAGISFLTTDIEPEGSYPENGWNVLRRRSSNQFNVDKTDYSREDEEPVRTAVTYI